MYHSDLPRHSRIISTRLYRYNKLQAIAYYNIIQRSLDIRFGARSYHFHSRRCCFEAHGTLLATMTKLPSATLRRRQSGVSRPESRRQGCVFESEFDVQKDTICGTFYLPTAYQRPAQNPVRNFSLPSYCDRLVLISEEDNAFVQGNKNHNRDSPAPKDKDLPSLPKDLAVDEPSCRKCLSPFSDLGPNNQLCQIPPIVLTEGHDDLTHASQLQEKLRARPIGMFPPSMSELYDIITKVRVPDAAHNGNDFLCHQPERETAADSLTNGALACENDIY